LFRKSLNLKVRVIDVMPSCRAAVLHCVFPSGYSLIIALVYFPCLNLTVDYECELSDCTGFIEKCFDAVAFDDIIVLGDMNFDCSTSNVGWNIFHSFC